MDEGDAIEWPDRGGINFPRSLVEGAKLIDDVARDVTAAVVLVVEQFVIQRHAVLEASTIGKTRP